MTNEDLERKLKSLLDAAEEANQDFDFLLGRDEIAAGDFRDTLGANLDFLREELDLLVKDAIYPGLLG